MPCGHKHKKGTGGAGGSPVSFRKREGNLEDKRVIHGECCRPEVTQAPAVHKGQQSNFD